MDIQLLKTTLELLKTDSRKYMVNVYSTDSSLFCWKYVSHDDKRITLKNCVENIDIPLSEITDLKLIDDIKYPTCCKVCGLHKDWLTPEGICGTCNSKPKPKTKRSQWKPIEIKIIKDGILK